MIAQFRVKLNLLDQIKAAQRIDPEMKEVKKKVREGTDRRFKVNQGIIRLNGRLCVPDVVKVTRSYGHLVRFQH